jgi:hypothetical protein
MEGEHTEALLLSFLRVEVGKLLEADTEKLWQILYRLDVSEGKVKGIASQPAFKKLGECHRRFDSGKGKGKTEMEGII